MSIGIKGEITLTVRDRRDGSTQVYKESNSVSYVNLIGAIRNNGLFRLIAAGEALKDGTSNIDWRPTKLIVELGYDGSGTIGNDLTGGLAGDYQCNTSAGANTLNAVGQAKYWGSLGVALKVAQYPLRASVSGASVTYTLHESTTSSWTVNSQDPNHYGGNMIQVPEIIEQGNPLGRRVVKSIRLSHAGNNPGTSSTEVTNPGLLGTNDDIASVTGNTLPSSLQSAKIHNYSEIGVTYTLSLADTDSTVNYGGFTDAYLNRLARVISRHPDGALKSLSSYGSGNYVSDTDVTGVHVHGTRITSAALFGPMTTTGATVNVGSGLTATQTTLHMDIPDQATADALEQNVFWLKVTAGGAEKYNEKIYIVSNNLSPSSNVAVSVIRGVECTTKTEITGGSSVALCTTSRVSIVAGDTGFNLGGNAGNYYNSDGNADTSTTPWTTDFGTASSEPVMIEYYTENEITGSASEWETSISTAANLLKGREIAARFPISLSGSFTPNDKVIVNNQLGIKIG